MVRQSTAPLCLSHGVGFTKPFVAYVVVIDHRTRQLTVAVVIVNFCSDGVAPVHIPKQVGFSIAAVHPAVGATFVCFEIAVLKFEGIIVVGMRELTDYIERHFVRHRHAETEKRIIEAVGAGTHLDIHVDSLQHRNCGYADSGGACRQTGWNEDVVIISDHHRNVLYIIDGIA